MPSLRRRTSVVWSTSSTTSGRGSSSTSMMEPENRKRGACRYSTSSASISHRLRPPLVQARARADDPKHRIGDPRSTATRVAIWTKSRDGPSWWGETSQGPPGGLRRPVPELEAAVVEIDLPRRQVKRLAAGEISRPKGRDRGGRARLARGLPPAGCGRRRSLHAVSPCARGHGTKALTVRPLRAARAANGQHAAKHANGPAYPIKAD